MWKTWLPTNEEKIKRKKVHESELETRVCLKKIVVEKEIKWVFPGILPSQRSLSSYFERKLFYVGGSAILASSIYCERHQLFQTNCVAHLV